MAYTTTELLDAVRSIASIPTSQNLFSTTDLLRLANHELQINVVPMVLSVREEYFVAAHDYSITSGQAAYDIPTRAIGGKLRDVQRVDTNTFYSLPRLDPEGVMSSTSGIDGFYLESNKVVLVPTPSVTLNTLRLKHFRRPNSLTSVTAAGLITTVDTVNNQIVVSSIPSTFTNGTLVDFIRGTPGFECREIDKAITGVSGTTISFASLPSGLAVGDYVALAGQSPIPQIPLELHPVLAQMVAVRCLITQGKNSKVEAEKLEEMKQSALTMLNPRVDGEPKKIVTGANLLNHFRRGW